MNKHFNQVPRAKVRKTAFNLSHTHKLSMEMGKLYPVLVKECLPGDKWSIDTQSVIRFAPMIAPVMHKIDAYIHYFFVPNRILWEGWEDFITNRGGTNFTVPVLEMASVSEGTLADHMGIPLGTFNSANTVNALPFRGYAAIWNEYYRDQQQQVEIPLEEISDQGSYPTVSDLSVLRRNWEKDYFTSALPTPQQGQPVTMNAIVNYKNNAELDNTSSAVTPNGTLAAFGSTGGDNSYISASNAATSPLRIENIESVEIAVEELRRSVKIQRWLERNMRVGTRYVEHLLGVWGQSPKDARLQRPEYIGGGKSPVVISEVLNHTGTEDTPQGGMAGHGINVGRTNQAHKYCEEHGFIIGIMSVIPEPAYMQGLERHFDRKVNLDYYYPEFAQLGEQAIKNQEIYYTGNPTTDAGTWGYQSRYVEYKTALNNVRGKFRTTNDFWHLANKYGSLPTLSSSFLQCTPDKRIFAVTGEGSEELYVYLTHQIVAVRPMPYHNDPSIV